MVAFPLLDKNIEPVESQCSKGESERDGEEDF
jgi:hypothetical protein